MFSHFTGLVLSVIAEATGVGSSEIYNSGKKHHGTGSAVFLLLDTLSASESIADLPGYNESCL